MKGFNATRYKSNAEIEQDFKRRESSVACLGEGGKSHAFIVPWSRSPASPAHAHHLSNITHNSQKSQSSQPDAKPRAKIPAAYSVLQKR